MPGHGQGIMSEPKTVLGARLRQARLERGWTSHEAAAASGLTHSGICNIERGVRATPGLFTVLKLCKAYGVRIEDICRDLS